VDVHFFSLKKKRTKEKVVAAQFSLKGVLRLMLCYPKIKMPQLLGYLVSITTVLALYSLLSVGKQLRPKANRTMLALCTGKGIGYFAEGNGLCEL